LFYLSFGWLVEWIHLEMAEWCSHTSNFHHRS
jgi:hypothetical protein